MELKNAMDIAASGLRAQGTRMRVITENVANANTTGSTPDELPYRRKTITFRNELDRASMTDRVEIDRIRKDFSPLPRVYDPQHPAADQQGYVLRPNVNTLVEMADMREAQRSYEANLSMIEMSRGMINSTVDLLRR
ncbi:MAG: flagellar basal body rod protein FlgC [Alphaproteobacteria bacterium]|nr:flagellar basal body rod protein FlgC [Alphaproteobacteria bacterium SS10]